MDFKVGDTVRIVKSNYKSGEDLNKIGKIVEIGEGVYTVKFDKKYIFTHGCGTGDEIYRWYFSDNDLELVKGISNKKVVILTGKYKNKVGELINNKGSVSVVKVNNKSILYNNKNIKTIEDEKTSNKNEKMSNAKVTKEFTIADIKNGDFIEDNFGIGVVCENLIIYKNGSYNYLKQEKIFEIKKVKRGIMCFDMFTSSSSYGDTIYESNNRIKWINSHYDAFLKNTNLTSVVFENKNTMVINIKTGVSATAHYNNTDTFDQKTGTAVAYAKYNNESIPNYI